MLINPKALYLAKTLDKEWFSLNPHRSHRLRRAIVGEMPGVTPETYVVIRQLEPGFRHYVPFKALVPLPEVEAPEPVAHAFFDVLQKSPAGVINHRELGELMRAYAVGSEADNPGKPRTVH